MDVEELQSCLLLLHGLQGGIVVVLLVAVTVMATVTTNPATLSVHCANQERVSQTKQKYCRKAVCATL